MPQDKLLTLANRMNTALFLIALTLSGHSIAGPAGASLTPTRIIVPAGSRSASVTLRNTSDHPIAYRISMVEMGLDSRGKFRKLETSELHPRHRSAKPIVRFSPRQVRLAPGASQVVRVIARRGGLDTGEYRSHMLLNALPLVDDGNLTDGNNQNISVVAASSPTSIGVTIPVVVRHNSTDAEVTVRQSSIDFKGKNHQGRILLDLGLNGNRSAFGDFTVSLLDGRKEKTIAVLNSFALYYPYPNETVTIQMRSKLTRSDFSHDSQIRVRFKNRAIDGQKEYWMDQVITPSIQ